VTGTSIRHFGRRCSASCGEIADGPRSTSSTKVEAHGCDCAPTASPPSMVSVRRGSRSRASRSESLPEVVTRPIVLSTFVRLLAQHANSTRVPPVDCIPRCLPARAPLTAQLVGCARRAVRRGRRRAVHVRHVSRSSTSSCTEHIVFFALPELLQLFEPALLSICPCAIATQRFRERAASRPRRCGAMVSPPPGVDVRTWPSRQALAA